MHDLTKLVFDDQVRIRNAIDLIETPEDFLSFVGVMIRLANEDEEIISRRVPQILDNLQEQIQYQMTNKTLDKANELPGSLNPSWRSVAHLLYDVLFEN